MRSLSRGTQLNISEMKKIAEARTKGEWTDHIYRVSCGIHLVSTGMRAEDSEFIAMAANNWDKLIAVVEAAEAYRDSVRFDGQPLHEEYLRIEKSLEALEENNA